MYFYIDRILPLLHYFWLLTLKFKASVMSLGFSDGSRDLIQIGKFTSDVSNFISKLFCLPLNIRYLERGFRMAYDSVQPDLLIFLGDLFDEGSISTEPEFMRYLRRFQRIFSPAGVCSLIHI